MKLYLCLTFVSLFLLAFLSSGCSRQEYINNKETGEIGTGPPSELQDGTYKMVSTYYDHNGYKQELELTIVSGIITKVSATETDLSGNSKTAATKWSEKMTGIDLSDVYQHIASEIISKQSDQIDAYNGASKTISSFSLLAEKGLKAAKSGKTGINTVMIGDTYLAELDLGDESTSTLTVSFDNENNLTKAEFSEVINGISRNGIPEYKQLYLSMCEKTVTTNALTPLTSDPNYPQEVVHYNALLILISNQRKGIF